MKLSKKEKRKIRNQQKQNKIRDKNVRQVENPESTLFHVPNSREVFPHKTPRSSAPLGSRYSCFVDYCCDLEDREGFWSWGESRDWESLEWKEIIGPFLSGCKNKTWAEVEKESTGGKKRHYKHRSYDTGLIINEAYARLGELKLDDMDKIFRFRLDGKKRLYGFVIGHMFYLVWYDRLHKIYPVDIQNKGKVKR